MKTTTSWMLAVSLSVAATLTSADAFAAPGSGGGSGSNGVYTLKISPGISRRQLLQTLPSGMVLAQENLGSGNEHARVDVVGNTIVMVYASSNVANQDGPTQLKCSAVQLSASGPPTIVADQVALTFTGGDRFGHPSLSCETSGANVGKCLFAYGSNGGPGDGGGFPGQRGNTQTYAGVLDAATCTDLTGYQHHVVLNGDPNNNEGAPSSVWDGHKHVLGYYANNDATYGELVQIVADPNTTGGFAPKKMSTPQRLINSNIGRPSIVVLPGNRALYAACAGQNRPCPQGNQVYFLNTDIAALDANQQMPILWKATLLAAEPDPNNIPGIDGLPGKLGGGGKYPASPQLVLGEGGLVHMVSSISDGAGHSRNRTGSSTNHILTFKPTDAGPNVLGETAGAMIESNHLGACSAKVGVVGSEQTVAAVFGSPPTSFGAASLTFMKELQTTPSANPMQAFHSVVATAAVSSGNADSGYLNNMLGRNPGVQGRNHLSCLGDVANPSYGAATSGFLPHVKTFIAAPWSGRVTNPGTPAEMAPQVMSAEGTMLPEDRNALFLTLVAAVRDPEQPAPPAALPGTTPPPSGDPGAPSSSAPHFTSGCSVAMGAAATGAAAAFFVLVFVLALVARRRWS